MSLVHLCQTLRQSDGLGQPCLTQLYSNQVKYLRVGVIALYKVSLKAEPTKNILKVIEMENVNCFLT